jgi:hypothetical protein
MFIELSNMTIGHQTDRVQLFKILGARKVSLLGVVMLRLSCIGGLRQRGING